MKNYYSVDKVFIATLEKLKKNYRDSYGISETVYFDFYEEPGLFALIKDKKNKCYIDVLSGDCVYEKIDKVYELENNSLLINRKLPLFQIFVTTKNNKKIISKKEIAELLSELATQKKELELQKAKQLEREK